MTLRSLPSVLFAVAVGCSAECPPAESIVIGGEAYCGAPCAACADCEAGTSCQFRTRGGGVCVDDAFLARMGASTSCLDPCPTGEARWDGACARICTVDSECGSCCFEPPDLEFSICAPRADLCR